MKQSYFNSLYGAGLNAPGFYAPIGTDPTADLIGWRTRLQAGEPYGAETQAMIDELPSTTPRIPSITPCHRRRC